MDENAIIINLKVIAAIQPNDKINTSDNYLNIESKTIIPNAIKRWWRSDDRNESLNRIDQIITEAINKCNPIINKNIKDTLVGLNNFKETYSKCIQTVARINTIIEKINQLYENVNQTESDSDTSKST
tara:strand:- start:687 stop:1070 length:384 start_codon:yes stop_codon:yes gene_type:complete